MNNTLCKLLTFKNLNMKKLHLLSISVLSAFMVNAQSNSTNWKMNGNNATLGDFIGTTTNTSLVLKAYSNTVASFAPSGEFKLNMFSSGANQFAYFDANGIMRAKPLGLATQYLNGLGQWVNLPTAGNSGLWFQNGNNLYWNLPNGNVGIGTINPLTTLDVNGSIRCTQDLFVGGGIVISDKIAATTEVKGFDFKVQNDLDVQGSARFSQLATGALKMVYVGANGVLIAGPSPTPANPTTACNPLASNWAIGGNLGAGIADFSIGSCDASDFHLKAGSVNWAHLFASSGNFSLNDNTNNIIDPNAKFEINSTNKLAFLVDAKFNNNGNYISKFYTEQQYQTKVFGVFSDPTPTNHLSGDEIETFTVNNDGSTIINTNTTNAFDVFNSATNKSVFRVKTTGFVYAKEINVQLADFPDYVFSNDYKMPSLYELENFINKNHHLPKVPAAKEILENGANIGEISKIQMEKIEELTLYIIKLQKEIDELKKKINN